MALMVETGAWMTEDDFLAGEIGGRKQAQAILKDSNLTVIDSGQLPSYESIRDIPGRVAFVFADKQYWTFEWIFQRACKKSTD